VPLLAGEEAREQALYTDSPAYIDSLDQAGGKAGGLVDDIQPKYGYTYERAEEQFNRRLIEAET